MELGRENTLVMVRRAAFGVYLAETGDATEQVLLPKKYVPEDLSEGDPIRVFLYKDSEDRPVATTKTPALTLGQIAALPVAQVTEIGAFLDWGPEKQLLLPFREQTGPVRANDKVLVALYLDKSERLCATMKLYPYLSLRSPYQIGDEVTGTVYEIHPDLGIFVAVDERYSARVPKREMPADLPAAGEKITARVSRVLEDGKLDLDLRKKAYLQMDEDAERLLSLIREKGGKLMLHDKSDPELIREMTGMSKNAFKRAVGRLYKQRLIVLTPDGIAEG